MMIPIITQLISISGIILVHYWKYCNLIGYSTRYLTSPSVPHKTIFLENVVSEKMSSGSCFRINFVEYFTLDL